MARATSRPWTWDKPEPLRGPDGEMICGTFREKKEAQANREPIVLAVNAHDDLVAACEAAEEFILKTGETNGTCVLAQLEAALAEAKGTK